MSISYHVYRNDGAGGPIDYSIIVATIATTSYTSPALANPGDHRFGVRAFDTVTGYEELNTDVAIRIVSDAAGVDRTNIPMSPTGLTVRPTAAGTAKAEWSQPIASRGRAATSFKVWKTPSPGPIDYTASPALTVSGGGEGYFRASLSGLADGVSYLVSVRSVNANGDDGNATTVAVVGSSAGPLAVDSLSSTLV